MPGTDHESSRRLLKQELLRCGFSEEETDKSVQVSSRQNLTSLDINHIGDLVSGIRQKFEAEKQRLEKDLPARWQSQLELTAMEREARLQLIADMKKVLEVAEGTDNAGRIGFSQPQKARMLFDQKGG
jgi:hypothetical protein